MKAPWLAPPFEIPTGFRTDAYVLRPLTIHDAVKDFDAVMATRDSLWARFGEGWHWPPADLTLEADLVDLAWHQKEFALRTSFAYSVLTPDEVRVLGCAYLFPSRDDSFDAEAYYWSRGAAGGLAEERLGEDFRRWVAASWPLRRVAYPGRDIPWSHWRTQG